MRDRRIHPLCALCANFGRVRAATVRATIPMCGKRPRYALCDQCMTELAAEVEDVELIAGVAR